MQNLLISDYLLGNSFNKKYKDTFIEQSPTFIHELNLFEFKRDDQGNYHFPELNKVTEPFIRLSHKEKAYGIFFIVFQKYMKTEATSNIVFKPETKPKENIDLPKEFTGLIKIPGLKDYTGDKIEGIFCHLNQSDNEVILSYVYSSGAIGYCRCNYNNIHFNQEITKMDVFVLKMLSNLKNKNLSFKQDLLKDKYKGRFTSLKYCEV